METLTTIAQAAAVTLATGGLEAVGGAVGKSALAAVNSKISALRNRYLALSGSRGQEALSAAIDRRDDWAIRDLAAVMTALAERDGAFRAALQEFSHDLDRAQPGATIQVAQKISNIDGVTVSGDFNLNM